MKNQTRRGFLKFLGKSAIIAAVIATAPKTAIAKIKEAPYYARWAYPNTVSFTVSKLQRGDSVYVTERDLFVRVRRNGITPIKTFTREIS